MPTEATCIMDEIDQKEAVDSVIKVRFLNHTKTTIEDEANVNTLLYELLDILRAIATTCEVGIANILKNLKFKNASSQ